MATATAFSSIRAAPTTIVSSASARKPDPNRRSSWWTPLFGWSSHPDYINNNNNNSTSTNNSNNQSSDGARIEAGSDTETGRVGSGSSRGAMFMGCFIEEKARELRKRTIETSTFHDIMYHSAIASRLASDVSRRSDR